MADNDKIDYERDWAGECRVDPDTGNAFVLRSVDKTFDGWTVTINDIFGGHRWLVDIDEWYSWKRAFDAEQ